MICRTLTAALVILALLQPSVWSADSARVDPQAQTEKPRQQTTPTSNYVIRDPATIASTPVKQAHHEADFISPKRILPAQATEEIFDAEDVFGDDFQSNLYAPDVARGAARSAARENILAMDRPANQLPIRPSRERRDPNLGNQPWTIPELSNSPEDYDRQLREEEFCRQVWACAGGQNQGCLHRWRRDMRRGFELRGMGRFGCAPSLLFSGMIMEPMLGYGFFGAPMRVCRGCPRHHLGRRCAADSCAWDGFCADQADCTCY